MHLPDHYVDPTTCVVAGVVSTAAVAWSLCRLRDEPRNVVALIPVVSAGVFAAQMLNFPIAAGTSGHLLGGALAGILLGPWAGILAMAIVVSVQAIVFGDGGMAALGANILNMAVVAAPLGAAIKRFFQGEQRSIRRLMATDLAPSSDRALSFETSAPAQSLIGAAVAGLFTVLAAVFACAVELIASGRVAVAEAIPAMFAAHPWVALAEAAITAAFVLVLLALPANVRVRRPAQVQTTCISARQVVFMLSLAIPVAIACSPIASNLPDGLESVFETLATDMGEEATPLVPSLLGDYALPGIAHASLSTALAGLLGALIVATSATPLLLLSKRPAI